MTLCDCTDNPAVSALCICRNSASAVQALSTIRRALREVYTDPGVHIWMNAWNKRLGGVPMRMVMAGRGDDVIHEARSLAGGMVAT